jgi:hypothetical protein
MLSAHAQMILQFLGCLGKEKNNYKVFSLETLTGTNSKKSRMRISVLCFLRWHWWNPPVYTVVYMLQPASGTTFRVTEGYLKAGSGFLKKVLEGFSFQRSKQKLFLNFIPRKNRQIL